MSGNILLIIDPQNDFHPAGGDHLLAHHQGSLAVPGANEDSSRIANLILSNITEIDEIYVTLDSHHVSSNIFQRPLFFFISNLYIYTEKSYCTWNILDK